MDHRMTREHVWAHWPGAQACRMPAGLSEERLKRWCLLRTLRDQRLAAARGWRGAGSPRGWERRV